MKVQKFGGSSLKDGASMMSVGEIIASDKEEKVIVVSAIQGITDSLWTSCPGSAEEEVQQFVRTLKDRHLKLLTEVAGSMDVKQTAVSSSPRGWSAWSASCTASSTSRADP